MFIFFINDIFYSFWQNNKGQIFFDLTCKGLSLSPNEVSLNYYEGVNSIPEYFDFDQNKNLLIQAKVTSVINGIEVEEMQTTQTIEAVPYVINGQKVLPC